MEKEHFLAKIARNHGQSLMVVSVGAAATPGRSALWDAPCESGQAEVKTMVFEFCEEKALRIGAILKDLRAEAGPFARGDGQRFCVDLTDPRFASSFGLPRHGSACYDGDDGHGPAPEARQLLCRLVGAGATLHMGFVAGSFDQVAPPPAMEAFDAAIEALAALGPLGSAAPKAVSNSTRTPIGWIAEDVGLVATLQAKRIIASTLGVESAPRASSARAGL